MWSYPGCLSSQAQVTMASCSLHKQNTSPRGNTCRVVSGPRVPMTWACNYQIIGKNVFIIKYKELGVLQTEREMHSFNPSPALGHSPSTIEKRYHDLRNSLKPQLDPSSLCSNGANKRAACCASLLVEVMIRSGPTGEIWRLVTCPVTCSGLTLLPGQLSHLGGLRVQRNQAAVPPQNHHRAHWSLLGCFPESCRHGDWYQRSHQGDRLSTNQDVYETPQHRVQAQTVHH
ncbi:hypothetical protein AMECASPLE_002756, partial [Ameca splendens]